WEEIYTEDAELILVAYGITARIAQSALDIARENGKKVGLLRPISLWPFPEPPFARLAKTTKAFLTLELSAGQMIEDVRLATHDAKPVHFYGRTGGMIMTPMEVYQEIIKILDGKEGK
ncbi:MAG: korA 5, partial [Firmicutes bacterium]|nr:korA 5 [Bacillota bacterium]